MTKPNGMNVYALHIKVHQCGTMSQEWLDHFAKVEFADDEEVNLAREPHLETDVYMDTLKFQPPLAENETAFDRMVQLFNSHDIAALQTLVAAHKKRHEEFDANIGIAVSMAMVKGHNLAPADAEAFDKERDELEDYDEMDYFTMERFIRFQPALVAIQCGNMLSVHGLIDGQEVLVTLLLEFEVEDEDEEPEPKKLTPVQKRVVELQETHNNGNPGGKLH